MDSEQEQYVCVLTQTNTGDSMEEPTVLKHLMELTSPAKEKACRENIIQVKEITCCIRAYTLPVKAPHTSQQGKPGKEPKDYRL